MTIRKPLDATDWQALLREAVDAPAEPLRPEDALAMRAKVIAAARDAMQPALWWQPLAIAATLLVMIMAGAAAGRRFDDRAPVVRDTEDAQPATSEPRQLQFATPGGTRIIWIFNSDLELKATTP